MKPRRTTIALGLLLLVAVLLAFRSVRGVVLSAAFLDAAILYLLSHLLRCVRLTLLAVPMLGLPARTAMLLHLYTAPVAVAIPFKLGELVRIQQFAAASKRPLPTLVMILVERSLDAVCLLAICAVLIASSASPTPKLVGLTAVLLLATTFAAWALIVAPSALRRLQRYILLRHIQRRARIALSTIDRVREMAQLAADCLKQNTAALLLISALIWIDEISALVMLLPHGPDMFYNAAVAAIERIGSEWRWLYFDRTTVTVERLTSLLSFGVLVGLWPFVAIYLERRLSLPPRDVTPRILTGGH